MIFKVPSNPNHSMILSSCIQHFCFYASVCFFFLQEDDNTDTFSFDVFRSFFFFFFSLRTPVSSFTFSLLFMSVASAEMPYLAFDLTKLHAFFIAYFYSLSGFF